MAPPAPVAMLSGERIVVTGSRVSRAAMVAREEDLADLKLYRVPEPVTVSAQAQKQVAFLDRDRVDGKLWHTASCAPWAVTDGAVPANLLLATVNDTRHGLGIALPTGGITVFESTPRGELFVGEQRLRDYASGQDVEIAMGQSGQVFATCAEAVPRPERKSGDKVGMKLSVTNANPAAVKLRISLGGSAAKIAGLRGVRIKDGERVYETTVPANGRRELTWTIVDE